MKTQERYPLDALDSWLKNSVMKDKIPAYWQVRDKGFSFSKEHFEDAIKSVRCITGVGQKPRELLIKYFEDVGYASYSAFTHIAGAWYHYKRLEGFVGKPTRFPC